MNKNEIYVVANPGMASSVPGAMLVAEVKYSGSRKTRVGVTIRQAEWLDKPRGECMARVCQALRWGQKQMNEEDRWGSDSVDTRPANSQVKLVLVNNNWASAWDWCLKNNVSLADVVEVVEGRDAPWPPAGRVEICVGRQFLIERVADTLVSIDLQIPETSGQADPDLISVKDISEALAQTQKKPNLKDVESDTDGILNRHENLVYALGGLMCVVPEDDRWGEDLDYSALDRLIV